MIQSSRHESPVGLTLKLPWEKNTARGFAVALFSLLLFSLVINFVSISPPTPIKTIETIPIELLNFGSGDGTGLRKGNLTEEGAKAKGREPKINLEDAKQSAENVKTSDRKISDAELSQNIVAVKDLTGDKSKEKAQTGRDNESIGSLASNDRMGSGLGQSGKGRGLGDGFGDIDWGGGGNRIVLHKSLPDFPAGVKASAQIILRFRVLPDGTVSRVFPIQKADPLLEQAAIEALKRWRFNPLDTDVVMEGTIPLTFILR